LQLKEGLDTANCNNDRTCRNSLERAINNINKNSYISNSESEFLKRVIRGNIPLIISVERAIDIIRVINLKKTFERLDIILLGASEAWKVAEQIAENNIKVMIDPHNNLPSSFETVDSSLKNIIILDEAGADYAIANLSALGLQGIGTLTQHAGNAVANGLDWDKAFAAITSTPASWFNLSLINNSLVIWDGDPLNVTSTPTSMFINGQEQSLESRQTLLRDRYNPVNETEKAYKYR
jgi:imidazolonepropionase-like amidohydrolase